MSKIWLLPFHRVQSTPQQSGFTTRMLLGVQRQVIQCQGGLKNRFKHFEALKPKLALFNKPMETDVSQCPLTFKQRFVIFRPIHSSRPKSVMFLRMFGNSYLEALNYYVVEKKTVELLYFGINIVFLDNRNQISLVDYSIS